MHTHPIITFTLLPLLATASTWWLPKVDSTWQISLSKPIKEPYQNVSVYDFDLYDNPESTIDTLHNQSIKAICYFSAGSWENWRPDATQFDNATLGKPLDGWAGERWLDIRAASVRSIMAERIALAQQKGCDAIDPDNIDVYDNGNVGFPITAADSADYVKFLAGEAHKRGMACGLKNGGKIVKQVLADVDYEVNEECLQYTECPTFKPFIDAGKPVFEIEYKKGTPTSQQVQAVCGDASRKGFSTLIKHLNLDIWSIACST